MTPNETTQLRTMAEMNRRLRRENEHLRESLLLEAKESKAFDDENVELFDVVHKNHKVRGEDMASRNKPVDARWEPVPENRKPFNVKECVFRVLPYAGLNLVLFWWQQADLLADRAAVPAMWVCAILMGAGIGRCIRGR